MTGYALPETVSRAQAMAHATSVLSELKDEHSIVRAVGYPDAADLTFGLFRDRALVATVTYLPTEEGVTVDATARCQ